ncbi:MAG TPA: flagellar export protein FliJ [Spirochaetota bacterium]|nr:flagellar export protein FliJ [Spirochaetota bacterium]HPN83257.1 flagellar export protein FliJ [Spirochaetota bacterium]
MSVFKFKLQKVLEQRIRIEDEKKNELARVQGMINRETVRIDDLKNWRTRLKQDGPRVLDISGTMQLVQMMQGSCDRADAARKRIAGLQPALEKARHAYIKARQERMAIEKIREKQKTEFEKKLRLAEVQELSEMAEQQYMRQSMGEYDA